MDCTCIYRIVGTYEKMRMVGDSVIEQLMRGNCFDVIKSQPQKRRYMIQFEHVNLTCV